MIASSRAALDANVKRLYLVRHAKSSWREPNLEDAERPLNKRGKRDAPEMGKRFAARGFIPDLMMSSPAVRAYDTAKLIAKAVGYPRANIVREAELYLADGETLAQLVRRMQDAAGSLMLFGHNPGFTDFANWLSDYPIDNLPTCALFCVDFDIDSWRGVSRGEGRVVCFDYPKSNNTS